MKVKRFIYNSFTGYICDNLTGKYYRNLSDIEKLLNEESDKANKIAEMYYDLKYGEKWVLLRQLRNIVYVL